MKKLFALLIAVCAFWLAGCENEPIGEALTLDQVIEVDSELYNLLQGIAGNPDPNDNITCIDFRYAFTLFILDEDLEIVDAEIIRNDNEFSAFLGSLPPELSISLSYPITSTLANGDTFEVNNNEELKRAIDLCIEDQQLGYCNGLLQECIWQVTQVIGGDEAYISSYFDVSEVGAVGYFHEDLVYDGTWITYFIENELHLNINLVDGSQIGADWNYDWKVVIPDEDHMELTQGDVTVIIEKQCPAVCEQFVFEQCETEPGTGITSFPLDRYAECFLAFVDDDPADPIISFHLTQEDAVNNANPLDVPYTNVVNPQIIYVRVEDADTGLTYYLSILIRAIACNF